MSTQVFRTSDYNYGQNEKFLKNTVVDSSCSWVFGVATSFGAHIVAVNLPEYAKEVGVGLAIVGLLIAAYDFAELVGKPFFGVVADHYGMNRTMLIGIAVFTFASVLYPFVNPNLLLLVRFLQGVGAAAFSAVSLALVGVYYTSERGRAYGIYNAIKGAGYGVSPIVGTAVVAHSNFAAIFYAVAGIGVCAFLLTLALPTPKEELGKEALEDDDDGDFSLGAMIDVNARGHSFRCCIKLLIGATISRDTC